MERDKELRYRLKKIFKLQDFVKIERWETINGKRKKISVVVPAYKVIDWIQLGYELGRHEAEWKSQEA